MLGAVIGDIVGSRFEFNPIKNKDFAIFEADSIFTDDSVLTVATADALLYKGSYAETYRKHAIRHPNLSYGVKFHNWAHSTSNEPCGCFGNGAAMRVSSIGWAFHTIDETLLEAEKSAVATHNHLEDIKAAQAVAGAIYLSRRKGKTKEKIKTFIQERFGYDLDRTLDDIRPTYDYDFSSQGSVPEAIIAFLESTDFEDSIRNAISLGGDADTQAAIAGSIAEAFYGEVPEDLKKNAMDRVDAKMQDILSSFYTTHNITF